MKDSGIFSKVRSWASGTRTFCLHLDYIFLLLLYVFLHNLLSFRWYALEWQFKCNKGNVSSVLLPIMWVCDSYGCVPGGWVDVPQSGRHPDHNKKAALCNPSLCNDDINAAILHATYNVFMLPYLTCSPSAALSQCSVQQWPISSVPHEMLSVLPNVSYSRVAIWLSLQLALSFVRLEAVLTGSHVFASDLPDSSFCRNFVCM